MSAAILLLAVLIFRPCLAAEVGNDQAPSFSPDSIVNSANNDPASLAPNVIAILTGKNLAFTSESATLDLTSATLPNTLAGVQVTVGNLIATLLYVSPTQINFLIPAGILPGTANLRVVRQSTVSQVPITLRDVAPAMFLVDGGKLAAQHADGTLITSDAPAQPGEIIVVYGDGLGQTDPPQVDGAVPLVAARVILRDRFRILVNGEDLPPDNILYAGITPGYVGLYQINLRLPRILKNAPELRFGFGDSLSQSGLFLPVAANSP